MFYDAQTAAPAYCMFEWPHSPPARSWAIRQPPHRRANVIIWSTRSLKHVYFTFLNRWTMHTFELGWKDQNYALGVTHTPACIIYTQYIFTNYNTMCLLLSLSLNYVLSLFLSRCSLLTCALSLDTSNIFSANGWRERKCIIEQRSGGDVVRISFLSMSVHRGSSVQWTRSQYFKVTSRQHFSICVLKSWNRLKTQTMMSMLTICGFK